MRARLAAEKVLEMSEERKIFLGVLNELEKEEEKLYVEEE